MGNPMLAASLIHAAEVLAVGMAVWGVLLLVCVVANSLAAERNGVPADEGAIVSPDFVAQMGAVASWATPMAALDPTAHLVTLQLVPVELIGEPVNVPVVSAPISPDTTVELSGEVFTAAEIGRIHDLLVKWLALPAEVR